MAHLSQAFTLEPGDVIATGTPAGIGAVRQPFPEGLLKVGDVVRVEIDGIGELRNTVVEEPEGYLVPEAYAEEAWVPDHRAAALASIQRSSWPGGAVEIHVPHGRRRGSRSRPLPIRLDMATNERKENPHEH